MSTYSYLIALAWMITSAIARSDLSMETEIEPPQLNSDWSPFCEEAIYYKPYVRIKDGREGPLIKETGPGILDLTGMKNLFVCVNGLVFLYFKITKFQGEIYDDAVMQYASHYCGFFNGEPGPGVGRRNTTLHAILLLGHPKDYRKISLQMFIAPSYNPTTRSYPNYTSLAVINSNGECILEKGPEQARIRVKGNPPESVASHAYADENEERHTTICRLDAKLLLRNDSSKYPFDTELVTVEEALGALELGGASEADLKFTGCWKYPLVDKRQMQIISGRMDKSSNESLQIDKVKSELNPQDGDGLKFWTKERLELYGDPLTPPPDNSTLASEVEAKNSSYHEELSKKKDERDPEKLKTTREELGLAHLKRKLAPYLIQYQKVFEAAKKFGEETKTGWASVWDIVKEDELNHTRENNTLIQEELSRYYNDLRLTPYDVKLLEKIGEAEKEKKLILQKLQDKSWELGPKVTKVEVSSARLSSSKGQAVKLMTKMQNIITEFEVHKKGVQNKVHLDTREVVRENFQDMLLSIKNSADGEGKDDSACMAFARKQDQCKSIKPTTQRACQIAINSLGGGSTESKSWRDKLFDLIGNIFSKACPYFSGGFATSINGIVKGYLARVPEGTGNATALPIPGSPSINSTLQHFKSNYKIEKADDLFPPLKEKDDATWGKILTALQNCEKDVKPLTFKNGGTKPLKFTFNGEELPKHVEQADKEFAFNWAVDMNYRIFATVLGTCLDKLETASAKTFYDEYHNNVLDPIRPIWLNNRDNNVFKIILGRYYVTGKGDLWTRQCMEASFIQSGKSDMRAIRRLYVNSYTEHNFFAEGPLKGTRSAYYVPSKPHPDPPIPEIANNATKTENSESPNNNTKIENSEISNNDAKIENQETSSNDAKIENPEIPNNDTKIENSEIPNNDAKIENPEVPNNDAKIENPEVPNNGTKMENREIPNNDAKIENSEIPNNDAKTENSEVRNNGAKIENSEVPNNDSKIENSEVPNNDAKIENSEVPNNDAKIENSEVPNNDAKIENQEPPNNDAKTENQEPPNNDAKIENQEPPNNDAKTENQEPPNNDAIIEKETDKDNLSK